MTKATALRLISDECDRATAKFGPFKSNHEGYAVLLEEVDELWAAIKLKRPSDHHGNTDLEVTQVGAMALRFLMDRCKEPNVQSA